MTEPNPYIDINNILNGEINTRVIKIRNQNITVITSWALTLTGHFSIPTHSLSQILNIYHF